MPKCGKKVASPPGNMWGGSGRPILTSGRGSASIDFSIFRRSPWPLRSALWPESAVHGLLRTLTAFRCPPTRQAVAPASGTEDGSVRKHRKGARGLSEGSQRVHQRQGEGWGRVEILRFFEVGVFVFRRVGGVEATMSELTASKNSPGKVPNGSKRAPGTRRVKRPLGRAAQRAGGGPCSPVQGLKLASGSARSRASKRGSQTGRWGRG